MWKMHVVQHGFTLSSKYNKVEGECCHVFGRAPVKSKPISSLCNCCVKYAFSLAMHSKENRGCREKTKQNQKKKIKNTLRARLSNEVHLETLHITTILDMRSVTVKCALKAFPLPLLPEVQSYLLYSS